MLMRECKQAGTQQKQRKEEHGMENQREPPTSGEAVLIEWYSHRAGRILGRICPDMVAAWSWAVRLLPRGIDRESIRFTTYKGACNGQM